MGSFADPRGAPLPEIVVIGVGDASRVDGTVGHRVATLVSEEVEAAAAAAQATGRPTRLGRTEVVWSDGDPTKLLEAWAERDLAVVIDTVATGAEPGTVQVVDPSRSAIPSSALTEAWRLAQALASRPVRLLVVGIEAGRAAVGSDLSLPAAAAIPRALRLVHAAIAAAPSHLPRTGPEPVIDLRDRPTVDSQPGASS